MEWNGVLNLIETKPTLDMCTVWHITSMRIIKLCRSGELPAQGAKNHIQMLCAQWAQFADTVQVWGVDV